MSETIRQILHFFCVHNGNLVINGEGTLLICGEVYFVINGNFILMLSARNCATSSVGNWVTLNTKS